ncbi:MAG: hypothetical protein M1817_002319 [Caeruleum heppii]|nr:MAG: hypothetical protein M1817_003496 [Caeruleum heppii]KAI9673681.1 MAG: hypothetical protein M1817_002319 [Caeruleum heppii]
MKGSAAMQKPKANGDMNAPKSRKRKDAPTNVEPQRRSSGVQEQAQRKAGKQPHITPQAVKAKPACEARKRAKHDAAQTESQGNTATRRPDTSVAGKPNKDRLQPSNAPLKETGDENAVPLLHPGDQRCSTCSFPCWLCRAFSSLTETSTSEDQSDEQEGNKFERSSADMRSKARTDGLNLLKPADSSFREQILRRARVMIDGMVIGARTQPESLPKDDIKDDPSLTSRTRIEMDSERADLIASQFDFYHDRQYNEVALVMLFDDHLASHDYFVNPRGSQMVTSLRSNHWKPVKPGPPFESDASSTYEWDIQPDVTYMLAINVVDRSVRTVLGRKDATWLLADTHGIGPYLTIELKCLAKGGADHVAQNQVAVAAGIWLYQRKQLRDRIGVTDVADLRHYCLIVNSIIYQVWVATLEEGFYRLTKLDSGYLGTSEGVQRYVRWSNAIHQWGLGVHARSIKRDLEAFAKVVREEEEAAAAEDEEEKEEDEEDEEQGEDEDEEQDEDEDEEDEEQDEDEDEEQDEDEDEEQDEDEEKE